MTTNDMNGDGYAYDAIYVPTDAQVEAGDFNFRAGSTKHTIQLSFDMKNVLNFFNSSWGVSKYLNPEIGSEARILKYEGVDAQGYPLFSTPAAINGDTKTWAPNHAIGQCWSVAIGIKYIFN